MTRPSRFFVCWAGAVVLLAFAAPPAAQTDGWPVRGHVQPRSASEVGGSHLSVGAETMDRGYTVYANWRQYLGPLGVKKARVQAGWARTEQTAGVYDWRWLDEVVPDMHAQGVEPWVNLAWGNALYTRARGDRAEAPTDSAAMAAWTRYVRALVARYKPYVDEWEVWNESKWLKPDEEARLIVATAEAIRSVQPQARVLILALEHNSFKALLDPAACAQLRRERGRFSCQRPRAVLDSLAAWGKLGLVDEVTYHPYAYNPDDVTPLIDSLRAFVQRYDARLTIRQGENGVPSEVNAERALADYPWTETAQAKWALRRMIADLGHGVETSYFSIADMRYPEEVNRKGLLWVNDDKTVARPKEAYGAVQHLAAVFDDRLEPVPGFYVEGHPSLAAYAFRQRGTGAAVVALWQSAEVPSDGTATTPADVVLPDVSFTDPVVVDLRTGVVYDVPKGAGREEGRAFRLAGVPLYDSPVLVAEAAAVPVRRP